MKKSKFLAVAMCCVCLVVPAKAMKDSSQKMGKMEGRGKILDSAVDLVKRNPVKSLFSLFGLGLLEVGCSCRRSKSSEIIPKKYKDDNIKPIIDPISPEKAPEVGASDILLGFKLQNNGKDSLDIFPKSFKDFINSNKDELRTFFD